MPPEILLMRHGEVWNPDRTCYGRLPGFRLSENGRRQVQETATALAAHPPDVVRCSPRERTVETATLVTDALGLPAPVPCDLLDEVHTPWDGVPLAVVDARDWDFYSGSPPGFEQPADVIRRYQAFRALVLRDHPDRRVLGVTHGDVLALILLWSRGIPPTPASKQHLTRFGWPWDYPPPASLHVIEGPPGEDR